MNRIRLSLLSGLPLLAFGAGGSTAKTLIDCHVAPHPESIVAGRPLVSVIPAGGTDLTPNVLADRMAKPRTESQLAPEVSVQVVEVSPSLAAGGFFDEGDVFLNVEPRLYELAIVLAEAAIERARLRLMTERQEAEIDGIHLRNVVLVLRSAIRQGSIVHLFDGIGRLRSRRIVPLPAERNGVLVREGIHESELTSVFPTEAAIEGMRVRTMAADSDPHGKGGNGEGT